jgi:nucleoid DNA-binding protein
MKGVPVYIGDLLYFNDCVIVPGFGGFIADYFPGGINEDKNTFSPPSKRIAFNLHIRENDNLLLSHISKREKTDSTQAKEKIDSFVNNTYRRLSEGDRVVFDGLGTFFVNTENRLQFVPDAAANYLIDSFGLDSFHFPVIVDQRQIKKIDREFRKTNPVERAKRRHRIKQTIVSVPLVAAMIAVPFYSSLLSQFNLSSINPFSSGNKKVEIKESRNIDSAFVNPESMEATINFITDKKNALFYSVDKKNHAKVQNNTIKQDSLINKEEETLVIDKEPVENNLPLKQENPEENYQNLKYHIIAGSHKTYNEAERFSESLKLSGFKSIVLPKDNKGRIRISVGAFQSKTKALEMLDSIRNNSSNDVWLLSK